MSAKRPVALVTGVGPGTGSAIVRRFSEGGFAVAMIAREADRLRELEKEVPGTRGYVCDVAELAQIQATLSKVRNELGSPEVLVHNAVSAVGNFTDFLQVDASSLEANFRVNTIALLNLGKALAPAMMDAGKGAIIVTGNTSALRGRAAFAAFAPTKAAQRILAESMARRLGPHGVHVAYVVIDAVIDVPWARKHFADKADDFFIQPSAIADEIWHVVHQPRSSWSFNVEVRPFGETW